MIAFNAEGLVPAIAQQGDTGQVLMLAWMNRAALRETLETGWATYWSRSRKVIWRKGETSGHRQRVIEFRFDCDSDTVLMIVEQAGVACHTGRMSCMFNAVRDGKLEIIHPVEAEAESHTR
ncbi:MAG: phosphoribosyl-AMP cyclohydrolase [Alphaproteobacteria bacterium]